MQSYDVIIAGGGPGGLSAAETISRSGASVLVLEQNKEIGSPIRTTGGSFIQDLRELGIPDRLFHPIRRCRYIAPHNSASFDYTDPIACVIDVRGVFQLLGERAIRAGAHLRLATAVTEPVIENGTAIGVKAKGPSQPNLEFRCKLLIDATGYRAQLLKHAGISTGYKRFGVGAEYDLYAPHYNEDEALLIVGNQIAPSGYAWFFPWGNHRVRAGVGILHKDSDGNPDHYLDLLLAKAPEWGVDLRGAQPVEYHFGLIPSEGPGEAYVGDGIMAVGDAANQASALVGEGIRWAIKAGRMAGAVAADALRAGDVSKTFLSRYPKQWNEKFGTNLRIAYEINRKIAQWDDEKWDRRTDLLKLFTPEQFAEALQTNLTGRWAFQLLWSNPQLLKEGIKELALKAGLF